MSLPGKTMGDPVLGDKDAWPRRHCSGTLCNGTGQRTVIVRAFVKKTQATAHREIALAQKPAKEVL